MSIETAAAAPPGGITLEKYSVNPYLSGDICKKLNPRVQHFKLQGCGARKGDGLQDTPSVKSILKPDESIDPSITLLTLYN